MGNIQEISAGLKLGKDGIWYSDEIPDVSYPADGNESCFTIEDRSFWFKHRNNCILSVVKLYPPANNGTILDIGGGNGFVSSALADVGFKVALLEPGKAGALNARRRGLDTVICATVETAQFKSHSLSAVGLFDVIEHIEDDVSFLKGIHGLMQKNGRLYITVPAYEFLWSKEDVSAGHFRRYTLKSICNVIKQAGLEIEFSSYIFRLLPIPIMLFRVIPYRMSLPKSEIKTQKIVKDHVLPGGVITTRIIDYILNTEITSLQKNKTMRSGGSCLVVAKRH